MCYWTLDNFTSGENMIDRRSYADNFSCPWFHLLSWGDGGPVGGGGELLRCWLPGSGVGRYGALLSRVQTLKCSINAVWTFSTPIRQTVAGVEIKGNYLKIQLAHYVCYF